MLRQSVFGRLAGDDDVNDADRLSLDPGMRQVVGGRQTTYHRALPAQTGPCVGPEGCTLGRPNRMGG